jgi:hypothetical protein
MSMDESAQAQGFRGFWGTTLSRRFDDMVYVVERYLPGLVCTELQQSLRHLRRLACGSGSREAQVRYLGSTIVPEDEACFCEFDAPSAASVADLNRRAGLPFDRIVPAVIVDPMRGELR